jgi:protein arginine kinase
MQLSDLAESSVGWLRNNSGKFESVISTRIRLARNLKGYPFPNAASPDQLKKCLEEVFSACKNSRFFKNARKIVLDEIEDIDRRLLLERHIISHEHAVSSVNGGVIIDDREQVSIMVNEEDHLRIQYITGGLNLFEAWDVINSVDNDLSKYLDFVYSDKWGYLTACPTNTGTGMRASCQMHLPGLGSTNGLKSTMENINKMGMVVRGLYGEGTRVMGNMLQISNQVTLGISEQRIIDNLNRLVERVEERERRIRERILEKNQEILKDTAFRSQGVLLSAYKISFEEALDLISNIRFGVYTKVLDIDIEKLNNLMIKIQPAHIQEMENKKMNSVERDVKRAQIIKGFIK